MAQPRNSRSSRSARSVKWILVDGNRASEVIRRARALAKKTDIQKVPLDVTLRILNSLIPAKNSLFFEIFSLLICVGNCAKSDCGAAVSCYEIGLGSPEIAKFPVKFPVSREFALRRVRSALQRQPASPATGDCSLENPINARQLRVFANISSVSSLLVWTILGRNRR
jgi:hypothetical protein